MCSYGIPNFGKKYRGSFETIALILEFASNEVSRFSIARHLNTNYFHLDRYLSFLIKTGFIEIKFCGKRILYKTSEKGFEFLRLYRILLGMIAFPSQESMSGVSKSAPKLISGDVSEERHVE